MNKRTTVAIVLIGYGLYSYNKKKEFDAQQAEVDENLGLFGRGREYFFGRG